MRHVFAEIDKMGRSDFDWLSVGRMFTE